MLEAGRIIGTLAELRERRIETFGSKGHRFELAPPLDEAAVRDLEARHGITLPDAYRDFVRHVGASGAGPYYGIVPPKSWGHALSGDVAMPDYAARPCVWEPGVAESARTGMDEPFQGAIVIADQGCSYYAMLVTTGAARGRVMYVSLDGGAPYFPEDADFLAWYLRWADELLAGFTHFWFGTQMPGTAASFTAIARDSEHPRRRDALRAMSQLPSLDDAARAIVALRVRDADVDVRAAAVHLTKQFKFVDAIEVHVRRALADASPAVRTGALAALVDAQLPWHDDARRLLADPDDGVIARAIRELDKARVLVEADILPLLESPSPSVRDAARSASRSIPSVAIFDAVLARQRTDGDTRPYLPLLQDLLAQVRLDAVDDARRELVLELALAAIADTAANTEHGPPSAAISGLAALAPRLPRAFDALVGLTRHPEPFFRFEAAAALGNLGDRGALPALRELARDPAMPRFSTPDGSRSTAWSVGENAKRAIAKLGG